MAHLLMARYGSDEFTALLLETSATQVRQGAK
jgi:GGDEF domain-containing protein